MPQRPPPSLGVRPLLHGYPADGTPAPPGWAPPPLCLPRRRNARTRGLGASRIPGGRGGRRIPEPALSREGRSAAEIPYGRPCRHRGGGLRSAADRGIRLIGGLAAEATLERLSIVLRPSCHESRPSRCRRCPAREAQGQGSTPGSG